MALKEWAIVVWALGQGLQILLLRKGGIAEEEREFQLVSPEFFLYPTCEHQQADLVQQRYAETSHTFGVQTVSRGLLSFSYYAAVTDVIRAPSLARMKQLRDTFVWNDAFLEKRYRYKPELPLRVLVLRTYQLPEPLRVPERAQYAGCRSWVALEESLPTDGAIPVLTDEQFHRRRAALCQQLR